MRKVYLSESSVSDVLSGRLLPRFLFDRVKVHETSVGDSEAFPESDGYPFDYMLLKERFSNVCDALEGAGIDMLDEDGMVSRLSDLMAECRRIEKPVRDVLERICENSVNRLFAIPKDMVAIECRLVDKITYSKSIRLRPDEEDNSDLFDDTEDIRMSRKAVGKRRFVNSLIQGASYSYSNMTELYGEDISKLNPRLMELYGMIVAISDYLLFSKKEDMTDDNPMQGSYVETHLGIHGEKTTIKAQGVIFPLLLRETIRGMFELFSSHGLPKDTSKAMYVVGKADFMLAEPWDMRLGVGLWDKVFGSVKDTNMVPYMFMELVSLRIGEFNHVMREVLSGTKKGGRIMKALAIKAEYCDGYQQFTNRIDARNTDKSVISDSYFAGADASGYEIDSDADGSDVIEEND